MLIGYARVSKQQEQDTTAQVQALKKAGAERIYQEHASGGRWDRPELHRLLEQLRPGDVLVVWKLDRLSRSLKDLLHLMDGLNARGAEFQSLTEKINTTTPAGRMMMQMVGSVRGVRARDDPRAHQRRTGRGPLRRPGRRPQAQAQPTATGRAGARRAGGTLQHGQGCAAVPG